MTIALDKTTGDLLWKSESLNDGAAYVSPILIEYEGRKMLVNIALRHVFAVDVSSGKIIWKIKHSETIDPSKSIKEPEDSPLIKCVTPLYHEGMIYVTGGYNDGAVMLKLTDGGNNVKVEWTDEVLDVHHGGVVLLDGYIYGANWLSNGDGNWCCIEWNTGKKMWEEHWKNKGSIISAEGLLYIYDERTGFTGLLRVNPEKFDMISNFKIMEGSGSYWAHPVIKNGVLYIRHNEALMAFDIKEK
jgi:outer membrane protein assembly factor BamB